MDRLPCTLQVARVAVFLATADPGTLRLAACHGLPAEVRAAPNPRSQASDLGFLDFDQPQTIRTSFSKMRSRHCICPRATAHRRTARPELLSALPRARTADGYAHRFAVIGLGRTVGGDFLSSEDVELLESLASYIGIALQNASLYARPGRRSANSSG